jgi:NAD(P)-dependent dehydrogenase (short-subunit alcohol dehydrogenase family)
MAGIVLITGGASGIGAETARLAASGRYAVAINYRSRRSEAEALAGELRAGGADAIAVQADVARPDDIERMFATVDRELGRLTALVNNAGISLAGSIESVEAAALQRLMATNVVGVMLCCAAAVRRMSTRHGGAGGAIVNVSSMAATIGGRPGLAHYAGSKAAIDSYTVGLAKEVGTAGIRANVVRPGVTETPMTARTVADPAARATVAATLAMNRIAQPVEIARAIMWLLSEQASFISGACLDANGGGFLIGGPAAPERA